MSTHSSNLVATDMGDGAANLINSALLLAHAFHSEITLFVSIPETKGSPLHSAELKQSAEHLLEQMRNDMGQQPGEVKLGVGFGPPVPGILEAAEGYDAGLIMIGSGSKRPEEKFQLGATGERVAGSSRRPVLIVKQGQLIGVDPMLCPVDLSSHSKIALGFAVDLAVAFSSELTVLTVVEPLKRGE